MTYKPLILLRAFLLCYLCLCTPIVHADEYRDSLTVLMRVSKMQLGAMYRSSNVQEQYKQRWGERIANAYSQFTTSENYFVMLVDIYEPECRRQLSQEELNELLNWYRTSIQTTLSKRTHSLMNNINTDPNADYKKFLLDNVQKTEKAVENAKKGKPTKIVPFRMSKNYRVEAEKYARNSKMSEANAMMRQIITPVIHKKFPQLTDEDLQQPLVKEYIEQFMSEALLGTLCKTVSLSELEYANKGLESDVYIRYSQIANSLAKYQVLIAIKELGAFTYWLKCYKPADAQQLENMLSKTL